MSFGKSARLFLLVVTIFLFASMVQDVYATSVVVTSVIGNPSGINGSVLISGADPSETIRNSQCTIATTARSFPSHGGLIDNGSAANGLHRFSCYFDGASSSGLYVAWLAIQFAFPTPGQMDSATVISEAVTAGGGIISVTLTNETSTTRTQASSLITNYTKPSTVETSTTGLQMPQPPQSTNPQPTNSSQWLIFVVIVGIVATALFLYSRRRALSEVRK